MFSIYKNWTNDLIDLINYGPKKQEKYRCVLVVFDTFSSFGCMVSLKIKIARKKNFFFENSPNASERKLKLIETDGGREFGMKVFSEFLKLKKGEDLVVILPKVQYSLKKLIKRLQIF